MSRDSKTDWMVIANELEPYLRKGDLDYCIDRVSMTLREMPETVFHKVLELDFTNNPIEIAAHFDRFVMEDSIVHRIGALYVEMNGFFINFDKWYFEIFSYPIYHGHEDYEWLSDWQAVDDTLITLIGMEALQTVYKADFEGTSESAKSAGEICDLLIVLRFQSLIDRSVKLTQKVGVPVLATAHEYDFIYEVSPPLRSEN